MITAEAVSLSISIARGLIKLGGRVDRVLAEKEAVQGELALPMPPFSRAPAAGKMARELKALLERTQGPSPDPLGEDRSKLKQLLETEGTMGGDLLPWYEKYFPGQARRPQLNPDTEFIKALREKKPQLNLDDPDARLAAFYIAAGQDDRQKDYPWRIALIVVDVLAEFGAQNTALFVRDPDLRNVVGAVLERFSEPDLESVDSWGGFLQHTLSATLNGALDTREAWSGDSVWLNSLLDALVRARDSAPDGANYIAGLLQGKGYPLLVETVLTEVSGRLRSEEAGPFRQMAADILETAAPLVKSSRSFEEFFLEHWGDLVRATFRSLETHGPTLLAGESPLLREVSLAMVRQLAQTKNQEFLSTNLFIQLAESAVSAVAAQPDWVTQGIDETWLKELIGSTLKIVSEQGLRQSFGKEGLETLVRNALTHLAEHPELLVKKPGLLQDWVGELLTRIGSETPLNARGLAAAALDGALITVSEHPALLDIPFGPQLAAIAGKIASSVQKRTLTRDQGIGILESLPAILAENPALFVELEDDLAGMILDAVMEAAGKDPSRLLTGMTLVEVIRTLLSLTARQGRPLTLEDNLDDVKAELVELLVAGLARAAKELGFQLDVGTLPMALGELFALWVKGELATLDPEHPTFKRAFGELAAVAGSRLPAVAG